MSAQPITARLPFASTATIVIARQPIHDRWKRVVGYELLFRGTGDGDVDEERGGTSVIVETFTRIGASALVGSHPAHVRVSRRFLLELHAFALPPDLVVLEVAAPDPDDAALLAVLERLAEQRYRISLACDPEIPPVAALVRLADSIKLHVAGLEEAAIDACVDRFGAAGRTLIATGVDTPALLAHGRAAGFDHFQGFFFCTPDIVPARVLPTGRLAELRSVAGLYAQGTTFEQLERVIARDVGLSYRLLSYLNSAYFNLRREISSVREALALLGLQRVRRWATLIALSGTEDKPHELTVTALLRGRLCELIGRMQPTPEPSPAAFFTVGLFSVMDAILDVSLADALDALPLAEEARAALLDQRGPMGDALAAVLAYERGDMETVARRAPGVPVGELYLVALGWADAACGALVEVTTDAQERQERDGEDVGAAAPSDG